MSAFATRFSTAAVALLVFVAALLFLPNVFWAWAMLPLLVIGGLEWGRLAGYRIAVRWLFVLVVVVSALAIPMPVLPGPGRMTALLSPAGAVFLAATVFWFLVAPLWLHAKWHLRHPLLLGVVGWILLVPTWAALVYLQADAQSLLALLGIVWIADSFAYLAGTRWGRSKLAPEISPGKTWEGVAGAAAAVAVYYVALSSVDMPDNRIFKGLAGAGLFAIVAAMSIEGDLLESWIKRVAGVKDSGRLLPGHGGILDRIDGLTSTMPLAALIVLAFA